MKILITHSPSDQSICRSLKQLFQESGYDVVERNHPLELYSALTVKGKERIKQCDLAIVLLTANAQSSYRVHQEVEFLKEINKDHFAILNSAHQFELKEYTYPAEHPVLNHEERRDELEQVKLLLTVFVSRMHIKDESLVYHVSHL
jgi:hypothetical protein